MLGCLFVGLRGYTGSLTKKPCCIVNVRVLSRLSAFDMGNFRRGWLVGQLPTISRRFNQCRATWTRGLARWPAGPVVMGPNSIQFKKNLIWHLRAIKPNEYP